MKALILISVILTSLSLNAQFGVPFPTDSARWVILKTDYNAGATMFTYSAVISNGEDTIISGNTYTKILGGAFREENSKVYYYSFPDSAEFLMYDFNLVAGDTVDNVHILMGSGIYNPGQAVVTYTDTVNYNGVDRKQIHFETAFSWIEGIGSVTGLFNEFYWNVSLYQYDLTCMSINQTSIYPNLSPGHCYQNLQSLLENQDFTYNIYPNPSQGKFQIESDKLPTNSTIIITDLTGKSMKEFKFTAPSQEISVDLSTGVYLLMFPEFPNTAPSRIVIR